MPSSVQGGASLAKLIGWVAGLCEIKAQAQVELEAWAELGKR